MQVAGVHERANVFILDLNQDGVEQITKVFVHHPASRLHIVCHSSPGCLALGNTYLSLENLDCYISDANSNRDGFLLSNPSNQRARVKVYSNKLLSRKVKT